MSTVFPFFDTINLSYTRIEHTTNASLRGGAFFSFQHTYLAQMCQEQGKEFFSPSPTNFLKAFFFALKCWEKERKKREREKKEHLRHNASTMCISVCKSLTLRERERVRIKVFQHSFLPPTFFPGRRGAGWGLHVLSCFPLFFTGQRFSNEPRPAQRDFASHTQPMTRYSFSLSSFLFSAGIFWRKEGKK